jgi:hypothetical protein
VVSDTGPGIAADELPHAFERFFLYSRYASNRAVGTGLGLAIVKELTEAMNGSVTVESEPGKGTRFTVHLPERRLDGIDTPEPGDPVGDLSGPTLEPGANPATLGEKAPRGSHRRNT